MLSSFVECRCCPWADKVLSSLRHELMTQGAAHTNVQKSSSKTTRLSRRPLAMYVLIIDLLINLSLSIYQTIYPYFYLWINLSLFLSIYFSIYISTYPPEASAYWSRTYWSRTYWTRTYWTIQYYWSRLAIEYYSLKHVD